MAATRRRRHSECNAPQTESKPSRIQVERGEKAPTPDAARSRRLSQHTSYHTVWTGRLVAEIEVPRYRLLHQRASG